MGAAFVISSIIAIVLSGSMEEVFAHEDEFHPAIFVVFRDGIESNVDSSLSCEEPARALVLGFSV